VGYSRNDFAIRIEILTSSSGVCRFKHVLPPMARYSTCSIARYRRPSEVERLPALVCSSKTGCSPFNEQPQSLNALEPTCFWDLMSPRPVAFRPPTMLHGHPQ